MPGYIFPGAFSPGSFHTGGLPTPSDPTTAAKSFKKNSPGCGCCCKCCDQCEGDSPCRMLVSIGGRRHTLKKNGSSAVFTGTSAKYPDTTNTCYWIADIDTFTSGDCEIAALSLTLQGPNVSHADYQWSLIAAASDGTLVGQWYKSSGSTSPACNEPHTLVKTVAFGSDCNSIGNAVIEPELMRIGCESCCPECDGETPEKWVITIGAETFTLSDHDYSGAHCYWQTSFAARVFGTSPGMGICQDYTGIKLTTDSLLIKVELTGGTTAVNWSVGFMSAAACNAALSLTLQTSNTCTLPTTITATPQRLHQCSAVEIGEECTSGCCPDATVEIDVDFSTATLTDSRCNQCNESNAVFTLPGFDRSFGTCAPAPPLIAAPIVRCAWVYTEADLCFPPDTGVCLDGWDAGCAYGLRICLTLWQDGAHGQCGWTCGFSIANYSEGPDDDPSCNCGQIFGNYSSALFNEGSCSFPVSLSRDAQSVTGVCGGSFPSTISIDTA